MRRPFSLVQFIPHFFIYHFRIFLNDHFSLLVLSSTVKEQQPIHLEAHHNWHNDATFNDVLAEQIQRAPYLIASAVIHVVVGFAIAGIMLLKTEKTETPIIEMIAAPPTPEVEDPPPPPPP